MTDLAILIDHGACCDFNGIVRQWFEFADDDPFAASGIRQFANGFQFFGGRRHFDGRTFQRNGCSFIVCQNSNFRIGMAAGETLAGVFYDKCVPRRRIMTND